MIRRILLSMDVLLDTRLGVINTINPEAAKALVKNPDYWERDHDDWYTLTGGLITNEQFAEAYALRGGANTRKTLESSFESGMAPFLYQMLAHADINAMDGMTGANEEIGIALNIAPYVLSVEERAAMVSIVQAKYGDDLNVKIVDYHLHELTVDTLAAEFGAMIIYEFAEWFKYHHKQITESLFPEFNVIHPKLFEVDPRELTIEERRHDLVRFRLVTQHNMDINFIDTRYFSLVHLKGESVMGEINKGHIPYESTNGEFEPWERHNAFP